MHQDLSRRDNTGIRHVWIGHGNSLEADLRINEQRLAHHHAQRGSALGFGLRRLRGDRRSLSFRLFWSYLGSGRRR